ncbi:hypothetical protein HS088_TW06G00685 [Tripterygium wilfordii]|uniref:Uncharacterized protein n=1 Tax=Tripterygium wilfordii TaxID=458696 RepID=A0A7J7DJU4_TRIWF|nr:hypothetical protein HS088_TW06G00685 [Tripterygium wilfordii]
MAGCAVKGGCPTDYLAIAISVVAFVLLLWRAIFPFLVHKLPRSNSSAFWIPIIQVFASFNLLLSIVMSVDFINFERRHWWQSCYFWAGWVEGPFGFGLLLACRIAQAYQLYCIFVKRRLPLIRSYVFLLLTLLPWIAGAAVIHVRKAFNDRCHMGTLWIIPAVSLHTLFVAALVGFTAAIRHIEFRFDELRDLWRGILVLASAIGVWVTSYILNEIHDDISWLQVVSRFFLLIAVILHRQVSS